MKAYIVGCGVAGSVLAFLLSKRGQPFTAYDVHVRYSKPCGEVIPVTLIRVLESAGVPIPPVNSLVKTLYLYVGTTRVRELPLRGAWVSIDKSFWISKLREHIKPLIAAVEPNKLLSKSSCVVFDCRGPCSSEGVKVAVWRAYASCNVGTSEALVVLIPRPLGMVWVFPWKSRLSNIGGGFVGLSGVRGRLLALNILKLLGISCDIVAEAFSTVTLIPKVKLVDGSTVVRVGEAAGFVMPLGGEGIRPAVLSALAAAKSLEVKGFNVESYKRELRKLILQVKAQSRVLKMIAFAGHNAAVRLLRELDERWLRVWVLGELDAHEMAKLGASAPFIAARVLVKRVS